MTLPTIPSSLRTSAAGFLAALFGWIAVTPGVNPVIATICGVLSAASTGVGLHFAADHRALTTTAARVCATCGRPVAPEPPVTGSAPDVGGGPR
jgi:uncharacterized membrane protein